MNQPRNVSERVITIKQRSGKRDKVNRVIVMHKHFQKTKRKRLLLGTAEEVKTWPE